MELQKFIILINIQSKQTKLFFCAKQIENMSFGNIVLKLMNNSMINLKNLSNNLLNKMKKLILFITKLSIKLTLFL